MWCIPSKVNAEFVYHMEDLLALYTRPLDPFRPLVCMDETNKQLLADLQPPQPPKPGQPVRYDYEYERRGVANLFMFFAPLLGQRYVKVSQHRTARDWAEAMRELSDEIYPQAEKIIVVLDNLSTHSPAFFYQVYPPEEALRLAERFEFHFTPKHGSWLNMAELELSVLTRQCLAARIPDQEHLASQVKAWEVERNVALVKVHWQFTIQDARIKLASLYPKYQP